MVNLGKIKGYMAEKGITQREVAEYLKISVVSVNNKLTGKCELTFNEAIKLSKLLNTPIKYFIAKEA